MWSQPRTTLAKQLGVSDVWVGKQCRASRIPMPPAGYWARMQHGKCCSRPPLPIRLPGQPRTLSVGEAPRNFYWGRQENADELILPPILEDDIEAQVEAAMRLIGKVSATRDLSGPHQGLSRALRREGLLTWNVPAPANDGKRAPRILSFGERFATDGHSETLDLTIEYRVGS